MCELFLLQVKVLTIHLTKFIVRGNLSNPLLNEDIYHLATKTLINDYISHKIFKDTYIYRPIYYIYTLIIKNTYMIYFPIEND